MRTYPKYKNTSIEWIGEIPEHWQVKKLSYVFEKVGSGTTPKSDNEIYYNDGQINWLLTGDLNDSFIYETSKKITDEAIEAHSTLKTYPIDSVVMAMYGATIGKLGILKIETTVNQACCVLSKPINHDYRITFYFLLAIRNEIINLSFGGGQPNISQEIVKSIKLPFAPLNEQTIIANFLDIKTTEIDQTIADKQQLINLYEEEKKALINEAVTKGLNKKVKLKSSGVDWLGDVPEHWEVKKLKYVSDITRGAILRPVDEPSYFDEKGEWRYLNISDVTKLEKYFYEGGIGLSELGSNKSARVEPNNLIITASATIGKPFITKTKVCIHDGFIAFKNLKLDIDYLFCYMGNPQLYSGIGKSNTQKNIYLDEVKEIPITLPSLKEQTQIVQYIETETANINNKINTTQQEIELLKEYKQALIFEAVTGKIDVRNN